MLSQSKQSFRLNREIVFVLLGLLFLFVIVSLSIAFVYMNTPLEILPILPEATLLRLNSTSLPDLSSSSSTIWPSSSPPSSSASLPSSSSSPSQPPSSPDPSSTFPSPISTPTPPPTAFPPAAGSLWTSPPYAFGEDSEKRIAVREAMQHAYHAYEGTCFGQDELEPLTKSCFNWLYQGLSIVDAMDTLQIMQLEEEYSRGRQWIANELRFRNRPLDISLFETVIRVLGGLMATYQLSSLPPTAFVSPSDPAYASLSSAPKEADRMFLDKAKELGETLLPAFNTPTGIPMASYNLASRRGRNPGWTGQSSVIAEAATIQMEFSSLGHALDQSVYQDTVMAIIRRLADLSPHLQFPGLFPIFISPHSGQFTTNHITWGAMGDSLYEYLLKMWLLTGQKNDMLANLYKTSMEAMRKHLLFRDGEGLYYVAERMGDTVVPKMDHLACFIPGMLALGATSGILHDERLEREHLSLAEELGKTCYQMYAKMSSGIAPEYARFSPQSSLSPGDAAYHQRPETVESLMVLWRVTHKPQYRQWGWSIFQSIDKWCKHPNGYTSLADVNRPQLRLNKQESFFLAETLKYLYLLFTDDTVIPLNEFVFNTEAHPLRAFDTPLKLHYVSSST
eukprot:TRINITY_DN7738_c0_g1_i1.p1 TRINITY_DN7738_c0_g1~~TRINITY_DN7738_c0_g1_i1.p1  ORF type:complete len:621 (+),score=169.12 TRINITY_DN7738_c0_g1_i1:79-1941(+)